MNTSTSEVLWPSPVGAHANALQFATTQSELCADIALAIVTAVESGLFTASIAMAGETSADVQYVVALLNQGGYQASVTGANLIINW
jgi:hypothetical protein